MRSIYSYKRSPLSGLGGQGKNRFAVAIDLVRSECLVCCGTPCDHQLQAYLITFVPMVNMMHQANTYERILIKFHVSFGSYTQTFMNPGSCMCLLWLLVYSQ
ncbi:unnamed protein product [Musa banksii]